MSLYQTKLTICQLLQTTWIQMKTLDWSEDEIDKLQDLFDKLLTEVNEKTKDLKPEEKESIDPERTRRRQEKEKGKKK